MCVVLFFLFKQRTAYGGRISEVSSDVCSSDLRPAYAHACENSIYVAHDRRGGGIGRALLEALLDAAEAFGFRQMVAVIGGGEPASVALHAACGFRQAGRLTGMGWKAGRWRSEEHTSELQSLMRISYAVFCLKKKKTTTTHKPANRI